MFSPKYQSVAGLSIMLSLLSAGFAVAAPISPFVIQHQRHHTFVNGAAVMKTTLYHAHYTSTLGRPLKFKYHPSHSSAISPAATGDDVETVGSLAALYGGGAYLAGGGAIAVVDAWDDPNALSDFNTFASLAGLPQEPSTDPLSFDNQVFQVVYATGYQPGLDPKGPIGWDLEESLDFEYAHGIAPNAKIYLVEAASSSGNDLYNAVLTAEQLPFVEEVSMSWGGSEFRGETSDDFVFYQPGVTFFASTGDSSARYGAQYPAVSPNVVAVGGTEISRDAYGNFLNEIGWYDSGGGPSVYEPVPSFQQAIGLTRRGTPDISADASNSSGVYVVDSLANASPPCYYVWGTSLACPVIAALANDAGNQYYDSFTENSAIYASYGTGNLRDIIEGNNGYPAGYGYDYNTGVGVPNGLGAL